MENSLYREIVKHTTDAVVVTTAESLEKPDGPRIIYVNDAYVLMTGYNRDEVIGHTPRILQGPDTDRRELDKLREALEKEEPVRSELINYKKNGDKFWTSLAIFPIKDDDGRCTHWIGIKRDITDLKQREQIISETLREKEALLGEIHHRVKNNLAVISGLMQLQAFDELDEKVKDKLIDCMNRVHSMAEVHEHLYRSNSFTEIDISEIFKTLVYHVLETIGAQQRVELQFDLQNVRLHVGEAIPVSLILNEVTTNVVKHSLSGGTYARIAFEMTMEQGQFSLRVTGNGKALPRSLDANKNGRLGLQLIKVLAKQVDGTYSYEPAGKETAFTLSFQKS